MGHPDFSFPPKGQTARRTAFWVGGLVVLAITVRAFLLDNPAADPPDPRWMVAGSWAGLLAGWRMLQRRRKRALVLVSALASGVFAAAADPSPDALYTTLWAVPLVWGAFFGLPLALFLYGMGVGGARAAAAGEGAGELPAAARALADDEARIEERLRELQAQRERVDAVDALLEKERRTPALAPVHQKVEYAQEVLREQEARYRARLWAIELVRWRDRLAPLADVGGRVHSFRGAALRLELLASLTAEGEALLGRWTIDPEVAATPEGERCLALVRTLLARCEEIRQEVLVNKARIALRDVAPVRDAVERAALPQADERARLAPAQDTLAGAIAALDAEYARLRDDHEIAREVDRALRELMPE